MSTSVESFDPLQRIVDRTNALYSLPAVATRILELVDQEPVDSRKIKDCLETDPALAARVLRVVNSSYFGFRTEITTLTQALAILGVKPLQTLVLSLSLPPELLHGIEPAALHRFWRHTLLRAVTARFLAERRKAEWSEEAFLAGLLQGIGMLVLIQDVGEAYTKFLDHVYDSGSDIRRQESEAFGFDHAALSGRMLLNWGLPELLAHTIGSPLDLETPNGRCSDEVQLARDVFLADEIALFLLTGNPAFLERLLATSRRWERFFEVELPALLTACAKQTAPLAEIFRLPPSEPGVFEKLLEVVEARRTAGVQVSAAAEAEAWSTVLHDTTELLRDSKSAMRTSSSKQSGKQASPPAKRIDAAVAAALERCRLQRKSLSLLVVELDRSAELASSFRPEVLGKITARLRQTALETAENAEVLPVSDVRFAILLTNCDRSAATAVARRLLEAMRRLMHSASHRISLSVGAAGVVLPPRNLPVMELIAAAERCLQAAQASGGDTVKSFEI